MFIDPEYCPNNDGDNEFASWKIDTEADKEK